MTAADGLHPGSEAPRAGLGLLAALSLAGTAVLAFWNTAHLLLNSLSARGDLPGVAWFVLFAVAVHGLALGSLMAVAWPLMLRGPETFRTPSSAAGLAAGLTAALFGLSILAGSSGGTAAGRLTSLFIALLCAVACGAAGYRLARWAVQAREAGRLLRPVVAGLIGFQGTLLAWVILRDRFSLDFLSLRGLMLGLVTIIGGVGLSWIAGWLLRLLSGACLRIFGGRSAQITAPPIVVIALIGAAAYGLSVSGDLPGAGPVHAAGNRPNVLLIVTDTLRSDHVGIYGGRVETPHMDALAARGTLVDPVYASASWTGPTTGSILTGLYPGSHGFLTYQDKLGDGLSMANVFKEAGYATAGVTANPVLTRKFGFGEGFDAWENEIGRSRLHPYRTTPLVTTLAALGAWKPPIDFAPGEKVVDVALDWLDRKGEAPYFLHLQFMDPHDPYIPPDAFMKESPEARGSDLEMEFGTLADISEGELEVGEADLARMKDLYAGTIRYMDAEIGRLMEALESRGLLENTLIVLTSDHGEEFIEHDGLGHEHTLYEELVRVPLIYAGPGAAAGQVLEGPGQQIDIAPTILEAVGLAFPGRVEGRSAWKAVTGRGPLQHREVFMEEIYIGQRSPVHAFRALRQENWKLIGSWFNRNAEGPARWELYDLEADPGESRDLSGEHPDRVASMSRLIQVWASRPRPGAATPEELDEETLEQLRSLGYVE